MTRQPENQPEDLAIWRFGVISPLLHRDPEGFPLFRAIENLAGKPFVLPNGRQKSFSADTLRHWLYLFRQSGLKGLAGKVRKDKGRTLLPEPLRDAIIQSRLDHPAWTVKRILKNLQKEGLWNGRRPSLTSIYRFTTGRGLKRSPVKPPEPVSSFQFEHFGDLWSADFLHGPKVRTVLPGRRYPGPHQRPHAGHTPLRHSKTLLHRQRRGFPQPAFGAGGRQA
jgi:hypothetical protein